MSRVEVGMIFPDQKNVSDQLRILYELVYNSIKSIT